jgi:hypothetical protein
MLSITLLVLGITVLVNHSSTLRRVHMATCHALVSTMTQSWTAATQELARAHTSLANQDLAVLLKPCSPRPHSTVFPRMGAFGLVYGMFPYTRIVNLITFKE